MVTKNNWEKIWNKRNTTNLNLHDKDTLIAQMKNLNGWDVTNGKLDNEKFVKEYQNMMMHFYRSIDKDINSMYEVGCGCGVNLFLFLNDKVTNTEEDTYIRARAREREKKVGGIDYSESLIKSAKEIVFSNDLQCGDALSIDTIKKYDIVISCSVFHYFNDEIYAEKVMEKMFEKSRYGISVLEVLNIDEKENYINFKRKTIENFNDRYKNLKWLFLGKDFFARFAKKHNLHVVFYPSQMERFYPKNSMFNVCVTYK